MSNSQRTTEDLEIELISRYLLGELSDEQLTLVEERYFTDPSFLRLVETVEDDLIDAYVRGEMSGLERQHFEQHFLTSAHRRQRVEQAGALMQRLAQRDFAPDSVADAVAAPAILERASRRPLPYSATLIAVAAAMIVMFVGGILLFLQNASLRRENNQLRGEQEELARALGALERELAAERAGATPPDDGRQPPDEVTSPPDTASLIASFTLTPGNPRDSGGLKEISFTGPGTMIRFYLPIDSAVDNKTARAVLTRAGGPELWSRRALPVRRTKGTVVVSLMVPAGLLQPGEYLLTLTAETSADEVIGDYPFRVTRR